MGKKLAGVLLWLTLVVVVVSPHRGMANNDPCWGDNSRQDIICVKITEPLLLSLRGGSMAYVQRLMGAKGRLMSGAKRPGFGDSLRFISNYGRGAGTGSGSVNITFFDDRAVILSAEVDTNGQAGSKIFIWNAYAPPQSVSDEFELSTRNYTRLPFCSDLSGGKPCNEAAGSSEQAQFDHQLMLMKEQFGSTDAEIKETIQAACKMGAASSLDFSNGTGASGLRI